MAAQRSDTFETIRGAFAGRPFVAVLVVAAGTRTVATAATGGFVVADEIFQYLEPAFRHVHGYGDVPWEYVLGARSWLLPGAYAILMRVLALAGVTSPLVIAAIFHALNAAASVFLVAGVYRLAERLYGERTAVYAGLLAALSVPLMYYSTRTLSDNASAIFIPWAFYFAARGARDAEGTGGQYFRAGLMTGVATMIRYPSAVFFAAIGLYLLFTGRGTGLLRLTLGFLAAVVVQGFLDLATWGHFLQSALVYFHYNVVEGRSVVHGVEPWYFYFVRFWNAYWWMTVLAAPLVFIGMWRSWVVNYGIVLYLALISITAHKEIRFLLPVLPLLIVGMAVGFEMCFGRMRYPRLRRAAPFLMSCLLLVPLADQTRNNWRPGMNICAAMAAVGEQPDATGLVVHLPKYAAGGYFHLRKNIPVSYEPDPIAYTAGHVPEGGLSIAEALQTPRFNYAIINAERQDQRMLVARHGLCLWRSFGSREVYRRPASAAPPAEGKGTGR